ncbi:hypothetical protein HQQ94_07810 [Shewanella sp. VB17]|uniref:hypothetical protein n=1 Tax=Shewanella sp. VB17 TaxID=2739432 RepID=UPI001566BC13|nr:hypothetical protein [Shewanella sp. VB17]NRD73146.1 hypothetical protein [Shewanella sp. VB17]
MQRSEELTWLLSDQIYDLTISRAVFLDYFENGNYDLTNKKYEAITRMTVSYAILSLSKLWETLDHYGGEINSLPEPLRLKCVDLRSKLVALDVFQFRSVHISHVIDKETELPIDLEMSKTNLAKIIGNNMNELLNFFDWLCPPQKNSVVSIVQELKNYCHVLSKESDSVL